MIRFSTISTRISSSHSIKALSSTSNLSVDIKVPVKKNFILEKCRVYADLSKFRLSSLVVMTTGAGFLATGSPVEYIPLFGACAGTALCAASAGTFNQVFERSNDSKMNRTKQRALCSGKVGILEASLWGTFAGATGISVLYNLTNPTVAILGATNIFLYAGVYTMLKPVSESNTWVGAIVGAIPPVMGWAAATGGQLFQAEPVALASLLFLWQFPHFFALSWLHREDYARGGFQMVAVNDEFGKRSADLIMRYSLYLSSVPILCSAVGLTTYMFAVEGTAANIYLLYLANNFRDKHTNGNAKKIFLCSLWYLPVLLAGFVFHSRRWNRAEEEETDAISEYVIDAKNYFKSLCVHNVIAMKTMGEGGAYCPKVVTEQVAEDTKVTVNVSDKLSDEISQKEVDDSK